LKVFCGNYAGISPCVYFQRLDIKFVDIDCGIDSVFVDAHSIHAMYLRGKVHSEEMSVLRKTVIGCSLPVPSSSQKRVPYGRQSSCRLSGGWLDLHILGYLLSRAVFVTFSSYTLSHSAQSCHSACVLNFWRTNGRFIVSISACEAALRLELQSA